MLLVGGICKTCSWKPFPPKNGTTRKFLKGATHGIFPSDCISVMVLRAGMAQAPPAVGLPWRTYCLGFPVWWMVPPKTWILCRNRLGDTRRFLGLLRWPAIYAWMQWSQPDIDLGLAWHLWEHFSFSQRRPLWRSDARLPGILGEESINGQIPENGGQCCCFFYV